jgi:hypothetical protein
MPKEQSVMEMQLRREQMANVIYQTVKTDREEIAVRLLVNMLRPVGTRLPTEDEFSYLIDMAFNIADEIISRRS